MDFIFKKAEKADETQTINLIENVMAGLENPLYFIPYSEWELNNLFNESYAYLFGCYDGDKLIAISQMFVDEKYLKKYVDSLGLEEFKVCEFGGTQVLSEYRKKGIAKEFFKKRYEKAISLGFEYAISTVDPENIGSIKGIEKFGMEFKREVIIVDEDKKQLKRHLYVKALVANN